MLQIVSSGALIYFAFQQFAISKKNYDKPNLVAKKAFKQHDMYLGPKNIGKPPLLSNIAVWIENQGEGIANEVSVENAKIRIDVERPNGFTNKVLEVKIGEELPSRRIPGDDAWVNIPMKDTIFDEDEDISVNDMIQSQDYDVAIHWVKLEFVHSKGYDKSGTEELYSNLTEEEEEKYYSNPKPRKSPWQTSQFETK
jgi:hypothetical protein